ncbi:MAG: amidohydrolase [Bacillota bacterium]|nr:amidohydrolase [Bacillota bacterium]
MLFVNGKIYSLDDKNTEYEALAIEKNKIVDLGITEELVDKYSTENNIIDLQGKMLIPGFNDSHMHLLSYGFANLIKANLNNAKSIDEVIRIVKDFSKDKKKRLGNWIMGRGWNENNFKEKRILNRYDLDKISADEPIFLNRSCGHHVVVVNSKALEICLIDKNTEQIDGGHFDVDENGDPTGVFRENARNLILKKIPNPNVSEIKDMIVEGLKTASKNGITSIQTDDFEAFMNGEYDEKIIDAYLQLKSEKRLNARIYHQSQIHYPELLKEFIDLGYNTGWGDNHFKIGPLKLLTDGSLGGRTALLDDFYKDDPHNKGISSFSQEELDELIMIAHEANMQVASHCIGSGAMKMFFNSLEKVLSKKPMKNHRHGVVHGQITNDEIFEKFKKNNAIAYIQPVFIDRDMHILESRLDKDKISKTYNWKTFFDMGIHASGGSDAPVEDMDVISNIYHAVARKDKSGFPIGGWLPEQKLSLTEALKLFTIEGAYASFEENVKGTLEKGKLADIVILSEDLYNLKEEEILKAKVLMTVMDGKIVYEAKEDQK